MASIDFDAIDEKLLQSLVDEGVLEDINLEYKRELPSKICETQLNKTEKKEILQDISAFANTDGGLLIYGIEDRKGVPKALVGLSFSKEQSTAIRDKISDYVKYNLEPPIYSIDFRDIDVLQSKVAFVFRIRKSVNAPHRIKLKDSDVFYGRRSNGVYPMNVDDMRAAFTLSEARTQMIRSFKNSSVSYAPYDADSVLPFKTDAKILLHLIPADAFVAGKRYELNALFKDSEALKPMFRRAGGFSNVGPHSKITRRFNLNGILKFCYYVYRTPDPVDNRNIETKWAQYTKVQLHTNGIIEASEGMMLNENGTKHLNIDFLESGVIDCVRDYLDCLQHLGVTPPIFTFLTLTGVEGYDLSKSWHCYPDAFGATIDTNVLEVAETLIPEFGVESAMAMKPCFDSIWNACGYPKSMNFDEEGKYRPQDSQAHLNEAVHEYYPPKS